MKAFDGERCYQDELAETTAQIAPLIAGCSFRSARDLEDVACQRLVAHWGRALSPYEHSRVIDAAKDLWAIATVTYVETFTLTTFGAAALAADEPCRETVSGQIGGDAPAA